jgi:hypothetical protein
MECETFFAAVELASAVQRLKHALGKLLPKLAEQPASTPVLHHVLGTSETVVGACVVRASEKATE